MRPIFCGNFEYDARQSDLERLFGRYGKVDRVDMKSGEFSNCHCELAFNTASASCISVGKAIQLGKSTSGNEAASSSVVDYLGISILFWANGWALQNSDRILGGFAFIYMEDERDGEDAIRGLDRREFGRKGRRLRVEWTKHERGIRRPGGSRRSSTNTKPSKTLFVINFDPYHTRTRDLERHFDAYGKIVSVRIRRNFAFVQYESLEDATKALDATNMSKLMDRVISVEYAVRDDDERRDGYSPDRSRDRSPDRGRDKRRSPSPYRRERGSPDYGRGASPSAYRKERGSPDYGRGRSPSPGRKERGSPDYGRGRSPSPYKRERVGPDHGRGPSHSPQRRDKVSADHGRGPSHSPYERERASSENGRGPSDSPYKRKRGNTENGRGRSRSPFEMERANVENGRGSSPKSVPEPRDSPNYGGPESPINERYRSRSRSPQAEE
ncbi:Splicing factor-like protein [Parasponia andersonii]|uniref:Splicing factor-like protein n=1 Tax=Parasponia andersonii TaxID=3476 RepID=A0A2P5C6T7_PARAD|nr:Splicing factor-like protein [Parasponia andersonii]